MTIYTVHEPPPRRGGGETDTSRFAFVRDGFHMWAFLLPPVWMVVRRLWLVLLLYLLLMAAVEVALWYAGVSAAIKFTVGLLISLLVGIEASSLRRWTYNRRRWRNHGVVVAPDIEAAERRFFDTWAPHASHPAAAQTLPSAPALRAPPSSTEVIGLFPEPETRPRA
jgi:hypothetical protein